MRVCILPRLLLSLAEIRDLVLLFFINKWTGEKLQAAIFMGRDIPYELVWEGKISQFWQNSFFSHFPVIYVG